MNKFIIIPFKIVYLFLMCNTAISLDIYIKIYTYISYHFISIPNNYNNNIVQVLKSCKIILFIKRLFINYFRQTYV